jgi:lysophospholipase L1-like esterase
MPTVAFGAFLLLCITPAACAQQGATVQYTFRPSQGDRIAFFGDSITAQDLYTTFVASHYFAFKPELNLAFKNAGVGGDNLASGIARIDRDLVPFKPTVVTCLFGMNDGSYLSPDDPKATAALEVYMADYRKMADLLREKIPGVQIVLFTTTAVDPRQKAPLNLDIRRYNEVLGRFSGFIREFGAEQKMPVVELFEPMRKAVQHPETETGPHTLLPDGIHPSAAGHFVVAELILSAWGER